MRMRKSFRGRTFFVLLLTVAAVSGVLLIGSAGSASANGMVTYQQEQDQPIPPAQHYAGSTGGDGYAIALYNNRVYNVFHHQTNLKLDCHDQTTSASCWSLGPETITDTSGNTFRTPGEAGLYLDKSNGHLWVYATRSNDRTAGVVCLDLTIADTNRNPYCGFVGLSAAGDTAFGTSDGRSLVSTPMLVGSNFYSFNYVPGANASGTKNAVLCFNVSTDTPCAGQPYNAAIGAGNVAAGNSTADAAIGTELIIPINVGGTSELTCLDINTKTTCAGSWPVATPAAPTTSYGAPYPLLDVSGSPIGFCLPNGTDPCFNLNGTSTVTPAGMSAAIPDNFATNSEFSLGPRVYIPNNTTNKVYCWDYSTSAACTNFPIQLTNLTGLYTVNPDPQRPTCLWINSDHGTWQIQNFDAYTGGPCTQTRVLASQFVVSTQAQCFPTSYTSMQILSPTPDQYQGGSVSFADGAGNPIAGLPAVTINSSGVADLTGLSLNTPTGLPQFLITLTNAPVNAAPLDVKLTWVGPYDPICATGGQLVQLPDALDAVLNDGTNTSHNLTEWVGTPVTNNTNTLLTGTNTASATGTVTYHWYSDSSCSTKAVADDVETITTPGTLPASQPVNLPAGTYYETVDYSGDPLNQAASTSCGSEVLVVNPIPTYITYTGDTNVWAGDPANISFVLHDSRDNSVIPNEHVTITLPADLGGGTVSGTTDANGVLSTTVTAPLVTSDTPEATSEAFAGDGKYLASTGPGALTIHVIPTNVTYTGDTNIFAGDPAHISFLLTDNQGHVLPNEPVTMHLPVGLGGGDVSGFTDNSGVFSTTVNSISAPILGQDTSYNVSESFGRQGKYLASSGPGMVTVHVVPTTVTYTGPSDVYAGDPVNLSFVLKDSSGNLLANEPVTINIPAGFGGGTVSGTTDANGVFTATVTASSVSSDTPFSTSESFAGQGRYLGSNGPGTVTVHVIPTSITYNGDTSVYAGQPTHLSFVLKDSGGNVLAGKTVTINIPALFGGGTVSGTTDANGVFSTTVTAPLVNNDPTVSTSESFAGQGRYLASSGPGSIEVKPIPTNVTYTGDTSVAAGSPAHLSFVLRNSLTSAVLANEPVTITLPGGGTVSGTTDANGVFTATTSALAVGTYSVSEAFAGQAQYLPSNGPGSITVTSTTPPPPPLDCSGKGVKCESLLADPSIVSNQLQIVAMDDSSFASACAPTAMLLLGSGQQLSVSTSATSGYPQNYVDGHGGSMSTKYEILLKINLPAGLAAGQYSVRITTCDGDGDQDQWTWTVAVDGSGNVTTVNTGPGAIDCTAKGTKCESILADPAIASNSQLTIVAMDDSPIGTSGATAPSAVLTSGQVLNVTTSPTSGQPANYVDKNGGSMSTKYETLLTINLPSGLAAGNYTIRVTAYDGDGDLDQYNWQISVDAGGNVTTGSSGGGGGGTLSAGTTACNGVYSGTGQTVNVAAGATCTLLPGTNVTGAVSVAKGGTLIASGVTIGGNLAIQGSATVCASSIGNDLTAAGGPPPPGGGAAGPVVIGGNSCAGNTITHDLNVTGETGGVTVVGNTVGHDMNVKQDGPTTVIASNTVAHDANCGPNTGQSGSGNSSGHNNSCPI